MVITKICADCNSIKYDTTRRITNKYNVYLCKPCSDKRRIKPRHHCNDCNKKLCRSYKIRNKYGISLCKKCSAHRQFSECHPSTKKPWITKKQPMKCFECNIELLLSYKIHNRFGIPLCKKCNHLEKYQPKGLPCTEEKKKKISIANSHPMKEETKKKISDSIKGENHPWHG